MKEIQLTQGKVALVDDQDYEVLAQHKWYAYKDWRTWYARWHMPTVAGKRTVVLMHRVIMGAAPGQQVDHWDGDGLHNWRKNLRYCTTAENQHNQRHKQAGSTSHYKGVCWHKNAGKWAARIKVNYKRIWLGLYGLESDAARAYNAAAVKHFGEFASLNEIGEGDA